METPQDPYPTIPQRLVRGFLALVGVGVLYAASIGPVYVLSYSTGFPKVGTMNRFYTPLEFIAQKTLAYGYLQAYVIWWYNSCRPKEGYEYMDIGPL